MMERIDYWRGFAGGFLAGVAIGAWVYFTPRKDGKVIDEADFDRNGSDNPNLHRASAESAGDPSWLIPERAGATRMEFERPSHGLG
jgi:hypothetical protein